LTACRAAGCIFRGSVQHAWKGEALAILEEAAQIIAMWIGKVIAPCYRDEDLTAMAERFRQMMRTNEFTWRWASPNSRMIRMFRTVFGIPGWEGGAREPCRLPPAAELQEFRGGLVALGVPEFDERARQTAA